MTFAPSSPAPSGSARDSDNLASALALSNLVILIGLPGTGMQDETQRLLGPGAGLIVDLGSLLERGAGSFLNAFSPDKAGNPWRMVHGIENLPPQQVKVVMGLCSNLAKKGVKVVVSLHGPDRELDLGGVDDCQVVFWNSREPVSKLSSALASRRGLFDSPQGPATPRA